MSTVSAYFLCLFYVNPVTACSIDAFLLILVSPAGFHLPEGQDSAGRIDEHAKPAVI